MQAILNERGGALIPVFRDWLDAHNEKVGGHTPHGGFDMDNGWIMETAWIKYADRRSPSERRGALRTVDRALAHTLRRSLASGSLRER